MEHNSYFDGKIQSIGFVADDGEATVGVVEPGIYTVPTDSRERITILSGRGRVRISGGEWRDIKTGDVVDIPANAEVQWDAAPPNVCYFCLFP